MGFVSRYFAVDVTELVSQSFPPEGTSGEYNESNEE